MEHREISLMLAIVSVLVSFTAVVFTTLANQPEPEPKPAAVDRRPDLSKCPPDVELWDCIKDAMWRTDL